MRYKCGGKFTVKKKSIRAEQKLGRGLTIGGKAIPDYWSNKHTEETNYCGAYI